MGLKTITGIPASATIRLEIAADHFERFYHAANTDRLRLIDVEQWGSAVWISMVSAFSGCQNLNISATDMPNLSLATKMDLMFANCFILNGPANIGSWDTDNITNMNLMFLGAFAFNQDISNWNTSNVSSMFRMFIDAPVFNQPIGNWDVGNVKNMERMFQGAMAFNQDLSAWNTAGVTSMKGLFFNATSFNQSLGDWSLNTAVDMEEMLDNSGLDCDNYTATLQGWNSNPSTPAGRTLGASGLLYGSHTEAARDNLIQSKGWSISGDSFDPNCQPTAVHTPILKEVVLYPNPTSGDLLVAGLENGQYRIYDLLGKQVDSGSIRSGSIRMDRLPAGIYAVVLIAYGQTMTVKVVKR